MQPNLVLLRRKELIGLIAVLAWLLFPFLEHLAPLGGLCWVTAWSMTAAWVALDDFCRRRQWAGWALLTFLTGPFGWALYCLTRKPPPAICSRCGAQMQDPLQPCSACGHATVFGKARMAFVRVYKSLHNSLVRGPAEQAKETAKHVCFALVAVTVIGFFLVGARGMPGVARAPVALIWALSAAAYWVLAAWWVYLDAAWRKMDGVPWAVLTLLTNVVGIVTYLVIRYPDPRLCPHCGKSVPTGQKYCPFCGSEAESLCPHCQAAVKPDWQFCPVCAARLLHEGRAGARSQVAEPPQSGLIVTGSVLDGAQGTPIAGARVTIDSSVIDLSVTTDSQGKFCLSVPEQRPYVLVASCEGYLSQAKSYSPGESTRNVSFALYTG